MKTIDFNDQDNALVNLKTMRKLARKLKASNLIRCLHYECGDARGLELADALEKEVHEIWTITLGFEDKPTFEIFFFTEAWLSSSK